jgi:hypothetical protein
VFVSRHRYAVRNNIRVTDTPVDNICNFKHLEVTLTEEIYVYNKIKCRLNSRKACYYSVQKMYLRVFYSFFVRSAWNERIMGLSHPLFALMFKLQDCWTDKNEIWHECCAIGDYLQIVLLNILRSIAIEW